MSQYHHPHHHDKYVSFKAQSFSPLAKYQDTEIDPYSPVAVEDLLQGANEWRNIQDIVRLTFKALVDVVKAQGETLKELERQMPTRASKAELNSGLSLKANISDISRAIAEVTTNIETKLSFEDCQAIMNDYVLKTDFQYVVANKASMEEVKNLVDGKVNNTEFNSEIGIIHQKLDETTKELSKKISNCVGIWDFQALSTTVETKANLADINEQLETKANKQSISNALNRKANKTDVDALLAQKAELQQDIQNLIAKMENKADSGDLDKFSHVLDSKLDKTEFNSLILTLANKAEKSDFEQLIARVDNLKAESQHRFMEYEKNIELFKNDINNANHIIQTNLAKKIDNKEYEKLLGFISKKSDIEYLNNSINKLKNDLNEELNMTKNELQVYKRTQEESMSERQHKNELFCEKLADEIYSVNNQLKKLLDDRRVDIEETAKFVKNVTLNSKKEFQMLTDKLQNDIEILKKAVDDVIMKKIDKKDLNDVKSKLMTLINGKVDLAEVQNALNLCQSDISSRFIEYKEEVKNVIRNHETEVFSLLSKKANIAEINVALSSKADSTVFQSILNQKMNPVDLEEYRRKLDYLFSLLEEKVSQKVFENQLSTIKKTIEELQKDTLLKANIKDVCTLLDTKSNIDDVNEALMDIHKELDLKTSQEELSSVVNDQAIINESLCTENIVGRWAWKSGELKNGGIVPWEIQLCNTLPDNFLWEKDKASVLTVAPGLYEINFGFFAKKKPTIELLVNGEPILSAINSANYAIHHPSNKTKDLSVNRQINANITGLTLIDFIVLPARAKLSIVYNGEECGEGFLGLKRL